MNRIDKIKMSKKNGTLKGFVFNKLRSLLTYRKGIHFITDDKVNELRSEVYAQKKLRKKYHSIIESGVDENLPRTPSNKVWICWLQGFDAAPPFIKACINSAKINIPNREIVVLSDENIHKYIEFPEYIEKKRKNGIISMTHYSDLIRIAILADYGGLWIDSTVLCTGSANDFGTILNSPLFVYKQVNLTPRSNDPIVCSSWLISAYSHSPILMLTKKLLYQYWHDYNSLIHYFLFHLLMKLATERYPVEWKAVPTYNNHSPHIMGSELGDSYSKNRWDEYLNMSSFHKLTRHVGYEEKRSSNYVYILKKYG